MPLIPTRGEHALGEGPARVQTRSTALASVVLRLHREHIARSGSCRKTECSRHPGSPSTPTQQRSLGDALSESWAPPRIELFCETLRDYTCVSSGIPEVAVLDSG